MELIVTGPENNSGIQSCEYNPVTKSFTDRIPQEWKDVLTEIQQYFPQAVIAGGALRDLWHDKPVKDIDVFIPVDEVEDNLWADQVNNLDDTYKVIVTNVYGQEGNKRLPGFRHLHAIYRLNNHSLPFELIFIQKEGTAPISTAFDISICQIEFNGSWTHITSDYLDSVMNKTIKVCSINRADRQKSRIQRMLDKYPDFSVEVPAAFDSVASIEHGIE